MSEYQYYEFRAIDQPLTEEQKEVVSSLSSRAYVTSHQASFVYNYGDFRGDEEQLMKDYFDIMLYMSNWGTRRLMFRIPSSLIDVEQVAPFCISEIIDHNFTDDRKNIILDLNFHDGEHDDWIEGEGWLDELVFLREELIQGDFRVLYLVWLKAAEKALEMEEIDENTLEPPVPNGLKQLSNAQKNYARYLDLDEAMINIASENCNDLQNDEINTEKWISKLSEEEKCNFLVRLSRKEKNLSILLNRRLHEFALKEQNQKIINFVEKRTISKLIELAKEWHQKKKKEEREKAELAHKKKLELLATKKTQVWNDIYSLIEEKKSRSYDKALDLLKALHELALSQGDFQTFRKHIEKIQHMYSNRPAMLRRIRNSRLIE